VGIVEELVEIWPNEVYDTAKLLFIFLFFSFSLGLTTQEGVQESVMSQVSHSHSHITWCHMIGMGKQYIELYSSCISYIENLMGTPSSSLCQLRLRGWLSHLG